MNVPVVNLDAVRKNLCTTRLFRDNRGGAALHGLKRRNTEWLTDRWHHINVGVFQALIHLLTAHEAREVEAVGNATLCSQLNHCIHHVARTCHAETHVTGAVEHHVSSLNKILGAFLHGDTT